MKTEELEGARLDYFVAKALGYEHLGAVGTHEPSESGTDKPLCRSGPNDWWKGLEGEWICGPCEGFPYRYSMEWERGGQIIERERINICYDVCASTLEVPVWTSASTDEIDRGNIQEYTGPTPLIAAMRAFVASRFGDEVPEVAP